MGGDVETVRNIDKGTLNYSQLVEVNLQCLDVVEIVILKVSRRLFLSLIFNSLYAEAIETSYCGHSCHSTTKLPCVIAIR